MTLGHLDKHGRISMVDITDKGSTSREAVAEGWVEMAHETRTALQEGTIKKGDALALVRLAGVMAAKKTAELIPLCHPLNLSGVDIQCHWSDDPMGVRITARCKVVGSTGVEMEAMTAVSVAALALYDMVKSMDRGVGIGPVRLLEKSGGKSGHWRRGEQGG